MIGSSHWLHVLWDALPEAVDEAGFVVVDADALEEVLDYALWMEEQLVAAGTIDLGPT